MWRIAVASLAIASASSVIAWAWLSPLTAFAWVAVSVAMSLLAVAVLTRWLWTVPTRDAELRWDGASWFLDAPVRARAAAEDEPSWARPSVVGQVSVAIDAGSWMLLRFVADASPGPTRWLPVERRSAPAGWHELRCAVHASRPRPKAALGSAASHR